jgi:hypothetical protein
MKTEIVRQGSHQGLQYKVVETDMGHFCGYVRTSFGASFGYDDFQGYPDALVSVHGGLTYGVDEDGWVGFDCAHAGDVCVSDGDVKANYAFNDHKKVWTPKDVEEECKRLTEQFAEIRSFAEKVAERGFGAVDENGGRDQ